VQISKALIKAEARRLGFSLVGVTTPDPPANFRIFEAWLSAGRHGEMEYLASERSRQRRANPLHILPECRSILVLGTAYPGSSQPSIHGCVAAYAGGDDYHDVLPERLKALTVFIEAQVGHPVPNRWYTDTGPLLERELAQRAGLGWIGKNTCLIHPGLGSYFLLSEILLGLELEPDEPFTAERCGSCTRCIQACPTGCILPDHTLDARRCISYLTIELKGSIPPELRSKIGGWVFGCDICQQVCPWNRFAIPTSDPAFTLHADLLGVDLSEELALTPEAFNTKFRRSPIRRARRRGYMRNIAVVLGNNYDQGAVPALVRALENDREALVRGHAAWALGQLGGEMARHALENALYSETDPMVLEEIQNALV
jgi:epoxyqueuosine reductase